MPASSTPYDPQTRGFFSKAQRVIVRRAHCPLILSLLLAVGTAPAAAQKRMVVIDQDTSGPGGSNIMSMMALLQSPQVEVLGITVVTGNAWRDEEARHALRMLELIGRTDVPVALGAVFPLVRTQEETRAHDPAGGAGRLVGSLGPEARRGHHRARRQRRASGAGRHARVPGTRRRCPRGSRTPSRLPRTPRISSSGRFTPTRTRSPSMRRDRSRTSRPPLRSTRTSPNSPADWW